MRRDHGAPRLGRRASALGLAVVAMAVAGCGVVSTRDGLATARSDRDLVVATSAAVHVTAAVDDLWATEYAEYAGVLPPGTTDSEWATAVERLAALPGADHACVAAVLAPLAGAEGPLNDGAGRFNPVYEAATDATGLCGADLAGRPDLAAVVDAMPAFEIAGIAWTTVLDARITASVDDGSPDFEAELADAAPFRDDGPRFGLRDEYVDLDAVYTTDLPDASAALLRPIGGDVTAEPYEHELDWLNGPDGWRSTTDHPTFDELYRSRTAVGDHVEANLAKAADAVAATGAVQVDRATTRHRIALGLLAAALVAVLASGLWLASAVGRRWRSLHTLAERDHLTGAANRTGMRARVDGWFDDRSCSVGLLVVDLDHFKRFNDDLGHAAGDRVLSVTAERLVDHVVDATSVVCRWGGDEFVVVLRLVDGAGVEAVDAVVTRLHGAITQPIEIDGTSVNVGATIGAAICGCGRCEYDDLFRAADRLLYDVKSAGRNRHLVGVCLGVVPATSASAG